MARPGPSEAAATGDPHRWGGVRGRGPLLAVIALTAALSAAIVVPQTGSATGLLDLRIYLGAARQLWEGSSIYTYLDGTYGLGSTYPPLWSVALAPLSTLDVHAVELLWTAANLLLWYAILALLVAPSRRSDGAIGRLPIGPWALVLIWLVTVPSAPVWNTLNQGQINLVIWALLVLDLRLVIDGRRGAGAGIGLATALKLHPALAVLLLVTARRWRAAVVATATFLVVTAAVWLVTPGDSRDYWTSRVFDTSTIGDVGDAQNNSIRAVLARLGVDGPVGSVLLVALAAVVLVLAVVAFRRALDARCPLTAAVVVGCLTALVIPISWTHHLVFLCFPLLLAGPSRPVTGRQIALVAVGAVLLLDPVGFGRLAATSAVRTIVLVALLAGAPLLIAREQRQRFTTGPTTGRSSSIEEPARPHLA